MSNKREKAAMTTAAEKPALVPRLRFPDFMNEEEWNVKTLKNICQVNPSNSGLPEKFVYIDLESVESGKLRSQKVIYQEEAPSRAQRLLRYGDVIFQIVRPYQRNNLHFKMTEEIPYVASTGYAQLRANESDDFLFQAVHTDGFVEQVIAKCTGSSYPAINSSDLADLPLAIPKKGEQQKIADCLSSIDELITLESQKLHALKHHKKGLMQQLFPAEGETVPKLRFPDFRDTGEWNKKPLDAICDVLNNRRQPITSEQRKSGPFPYYGASGIVDFVDNYLFDERLVLIGEDGAKWGAFEKSAFIVEGKYWVNNHAHVLRPTQINDVLLENYLVMLDLSPYITGAAPPKLTLAKLKGLEICFPSSPSEQQKIADCLTSLDELIALQTQKIDALKAHKKGLMQQLFPKTEDVAI